MRVAVTGATGFLGRHITESLLADGHDVRILARNKEKAEPFRDRVSKIVVGEITDESALNNLVSDSEIVFHLVSNFRTASGPPESYTRINRDGTVRMLEAARSAEVKRFIHCSTIGVHGNVRSTPADEESPYNPGDLYQKTKMQAELACHKAMEQGGMDIVIIRPCSLYGPEDLRMLKMFKMLAKRTFFLVGACKENFHAVYIDDVVEGFMRVMNTPGIGGETFLIGGPGYVPLGEYINIAARAVGTPPPFLRFPYWLFISAAAIFELVCVPFGIEPPLHRRRVRFYKNNRAFSIEKARKVLGYEPEIDLEEGMRRTVAWYRENGHL